AFIEADRVNTTIADLRCVLPQQRNSAGIRLDTVYAGRRIEQAKIGGGETDIGADVEHGLRAGHARGVLVAVPLKDFREYKPRTLVVGNHELDLSRVDADHDPSQLAGARPLLERITGHGELDQALGRRRKESGNPLRSSLERDPLARVN